ncbi:glycosyltransferase family 2 protein [Sphingobacterium sp. NGMCC 1.201703]|uniref:glycosyltransferase family 2 protein n=1 Tax=Sphingobacterium sp. NGMCC 1.201703 TaxID=3388657 RepID=UPI0039FD511D
MAAHPKFSIITVVYNNVRDIEHTIKSVVNQTYDNIEYIVIDGESSDGTLAVIQKYQDKIAVLLSEKDKGIYDAMNKGLALATGDYVLFLNSGDEIYDLNSIENLARLSDDADILYGETILVDDNRAIIGERRHKVPANFDWKSFRYGMNICHQAIYIKRTIAEPYDLSYKLCADIDWVIRCAKKANKSVNAHQYVARYLVGGMSKQKHKESLKERFAIFKHYYGAIPNLFNHGVIALKAIWYRINYGKPQD